tara:strand:- start:371 stop:592 length:222 start_codon:yes stop_codon:yes gene_type:complete
MENDGSFLKFVDKVLYRLKAGQREYGNKSFSMEPDVLLQEIEEEILDICGWAYILHVRMEKLRSAVVAIDEKR